MGYTLHLHLRNSSAPGTGKELLATNGTPYRLHHSPEPELAQCFSNSKQQSTLHCIIELYWHSYRRTQAENAACCASSVRIMPVTYCRSKIDPFPPTRYIYRTEVKPGKHSDTRIKPLPLTNGHGRYITATPKRTLFWGGIAVTYNGLLNKGRRTIKYMTISAALIQVTPLGYLTHISITTPVVSALKN